MAEAAWEAASAEALELRGALSRSSAKASAAEALCERRGAELSRLSAAADGAEAAWRIRSAQAATEGSERRALRQALEASAEGSPPHPHPC